MCVQEKQLLACCPKLAFTHHENRYVERQASEKGPEKRWYNRLFLQEFRVTDLLSEKVYVSGLTSLWPEITRILNIPL
jgi:hypothetical protein